MRTVKLDNPIVIVGAGCFGLSTAYHLLKRGFTNVTVLDRAEELPAKDAASTDLNKSEKKNTSSYSF
jgi:sarcosine oxidase/L-pipecolate oxidase